MSLNERVSENVRVIAVSRGTTPTAVARNLGRSHHWIQAKIAGRNAWSLDDIELVAAELQVAPVALIGAPLALQVVESAQAAADRVVGPARDAVDRMLGPAQETVDRTVGAALRATEFNTVRPKGLEPPTFWSVVRRALTRRRGFRADYALCA